MSDSGCRRDRGSQGLVVDNRCDFLDNLCRGSVDDLPGFALVDRDGVPDLPLSGRVGFVAVFSARTFVLSLALGILASG